MRRARSAPALNTHAMAGRSTTYQLANGDKLRIGKRILDALSMIAQTGCDLEQAAEDAGCTHNKLLGTIKSEDGRAILLDMLQTGETVSLARARATVHALMIDADSDSVRLKAAQDVLDRVEGKAAQVIRHTGTVETVHRVVVGVEAAPAQDLIETAPGVYALPDDVALPSQGKAKP